MDRRIEQEYILPNVTHLLLKLLRGKPYEYRYRQNKRILCSLGAIPVKFFRRVPSSLHPEGPVKAYFFLFSKTE